MYSNETNLICKPHPPTGLGNRLKCIVSFLRYYNNPEEIVLVWDNHGWVNASFFDLFQFDINTKIIEINSISTEPSKLPDNYWRLCVFENDEKPEIIKNNDPYDRNLYRIDLLYNDTPEYWLKTYSKYFEKLNPSQKVAEIMQSVDITEDMIAVQIRNNKDWSDTGRTCHLNDFIEKMKEYPKTTKFFLSAMNKDVSNIITDIFQDQIIEVPDKDYTSSFYAAADMFLLSIPLRALCSCGSTFYEIAWWLNKKHPDVEVIGDYSDWSTFTP